MISSREVRRVVTQQAQSSRLECDGAVPPIEMAGSRVFELWRAGANDVGAPLSEPWSLDPPAGGHVFRIAEFPPAAPGDTPWMHRTSTIDYAVILEGELTLVTEAGETVLAAGDVVVQQSAEHGWVNRGNAPCRMAVVLIDQRTHV